MDHGQRTVRRRALGGLRVGALVFAGFAPAALAGGPIPVPADGLGPQAFVDWYRDQEGLGGDHELVAVRSGPSALRRRTYHRFEHRYRGFTVIGDGISVHAEDGAAVRAWGRVRTDMPPIVTVREAKLVAAAKAALAAELATTEPIEYAVDPPDCSPVILADRPDPVFAYRCILVTSSPAGSYLVAVRVSDLSTLYVRDRWVRWSPVDIHAESLLHGQVGPLAAEQEEPPEQRCRLVSPETRTFDARGLAGEPAISERMEVESGPACQFVTSLARNGVTAQWGAQRAIDTYDVIFSERPLQTYLSEGWLGLHVNSSVEFAVYDPDTQSIFIETTPENFAALTVVAHEAGHALQHANGVVDAEGEYGAFRESWADLLGALTEETTIPSGTDFVLHDNRDLVDPISAGRPDVYLGQNWQPNDTHNNSALLSRWFTLLARGGEGFNSAGAPYSVLPVGTGWETTMELPMRIVTAVLFETLQSSDQYPEMREATQIAAQDFCGGHSLLARSAHEAWRAVGLEQMPWTAPPSHPADGAAQVPPWPVKFAWPVDPSQLAAARDLQIAGDLSFGDASSRIVLDLEQIGGVEHWVAEVVLAPDKDYAWRARPDDQSPYQCWRPPAEFHTADQVPEPVSPHGGLHHPWRLPFEVSVPAGTETIEIEVGFAPDLGGQGADQLVFPPKFFPAGPHDEGKRLEFSLTLPLGVDRLFWRARGHRDGYSSAWSPERSFGTTTPEVELISPQGLIYPWKVEFEWEPVPGADFYEGELRLPEVPAQMGAFTVPAEHTSVTRSFDVLDRPPDYDLKSWLVHAVGPPLGSDLQPEPEETRERSDPSPEWTFTLDGEATRAVPTRPIYSPVAKGCPFVGAPLKITWDPVPEATAMEVRIYRALNDQSTGDPVYESVVPAPLIYHDVTDPAAVRPSFDGGVIRRSFKVELRARGPTDYDGLPGADDGYTRGMRPDSGPSTVGLYHLASTVPTPLDPGTVFPQQPWAWNAIRMAWATDLAAGPFRVELHDRADCSDGSPDTYTAVGHSHGATAYQDFGQEGRIYSWRVRPQDAQCSYSQIAWTECTNYQVGQNATPSPPPVACDTQVHEGSNFPETHVVELGQSSGTAVLRLNTFTVPDAMFVVYENQLVLPTGCYGTGTLFDGCSGPCCCDDAGECWCEIPYSGQSTQMQVTVNPNCLGTPDTRWWFQLECPQ